MTITPTSPGMACAVAAEATLPEARITLLERASAFAPVSAGIVLGRMPLRCLIVAACRSRR